MSISQKPYGVDLIGRTMTLYTMTNQKGASVSVLDFGAHVVSIKVPDAQGNMTDVCLGFDSYEEYDKGAGFLGATVGRYGNRIGGAKFTLNGQEYALFKNDGENSLHGGREGFDKKWWKCDTLEDSGEDTLIFTYIAHDGEEGYPGKMHVQVAFSWDNDCALTIRYLAESDKDTVVNLTNHSYFNLSGEDDILNHKLLVHSSAVTDVTPDLIPSGELLPVEGTPLDLSAGALLGERIRRQDEHRLLKGVNGFDVNYVIAGEGLREAAVLSGEKSGITMRVLTTEPGMQVYTGQGLNANGHGGKHYGAFAGVALETQHYPDSPNHPEFPTTTLRVGDVYESTTVYAFSAKKG